MIGRKIEHRDADGNVTGTSTAPLGCTGCLGLALAGLLALGILGAVVAYPWTLAVVVPLVALAVWGAVQKRKKEPES